MPGIRKNPPSLLWWEWSGVVLFAVAVLAYGAILIVRDGAGQGSSEWTRLIQAGQAARANEEIYTRHASGFSGPPILAALASPLADVPWELSLACCYLLNVLCLALSAHWLAAAVSPAVETGCRRWWHLRLLPTALLVAVVGSGMTSGFMHGLVLLLFSRLVVALMGRQSFGAGVWLGGAITLNMTSLLLVLLPICRRDRGMTMGTVLGLVLGLLILPGLAYGLQRTNRMNAGYLENVKQATVHAMERRDNQSLLAMIQRQLPSAWNSANVVFAIAGTMLAFLMLINGGVMNWRGEQASVGFMHLLGAMLAVVSLGQSEYSGMQLCYLLPCLVAVLMDGVHRTNWIVALALACCTAARWQAGWPLVGTLMIWGVSISALSMRQRQVRETVESADPFVKLPRAA